MLFLGNHQVGVESLLFSIIASALSETPTVTLAKIEHKETWLGKLIEHCFRYPDVEDPEVITFFDRKVKTSLPLILGRLAEEMMGDKRSVMVHVEGTRSLDCTEPVKKMSGAFLDMALKVNVPVVPVRFVGGLPRQQMGKRIEFPINMGKQSIYIGRPILPSELAPMHYGERKARVIEAINTLGPSNDLEEPLPGDASFGQAVHAWQQKYGVSQEHAVLGCVLQEQEALSEELTFLLQSSQANELPEQPSREWLQELGHRILGSHWSGRLD